MHIIQKCWLQPVPATHREAIHLHLLFFSQNYTWSWPNSRWLGNIFTWTDFNLFLYLLICEFSQSLAEAAVLLYTLWTPASSQRRLGPDIGRHFTAEKVACGTSCPAILLLAMSGQILCRAQLGSFTGKWSLCLPPSCCLGFVPLAQPCFSGRADWDFCTGNRQRRDFESCLQMFQSFTESALMQCGRMPTAAVLNCTE